LSGKRLQLLLETVPTIARPAILWNPESRDAALSYEETKEAAQAMGSQAQSLEVRAPPDFARARQVAIDAGADGLIVLTDSLVRTHYSVVTGLASNARLPAMYDQPFLYMNFGGLMAYGPNVEDLARRAATYVDQILKGASPTDLPIERPSRLDFVISLKAARALGLTIPQPVLQQVTQAIE
jgi:putative ABC transport system substrate-binding protein